jgi:CRP/FNR family transcriptional regulator, nitrogen fixation regulation protein
MVSTVSILPTRSPSDDDWRSRPPIAVNLKFAKRQTVFHAGDPARRIYEVVAGTLMVFKMLADGRRQIVEIVPAGWLCGFAKDGRYDGSCEALTDAVAHAYVRRDLDADDPLSGRLFHQAEEQFCVMHDHVMSLGRKSSEERLATFLMRFMPTRGKQDCAGPTASIDDADLHIPLSRAEIGDYLGLTIETVSRTITALAKKGLIRVGSKHGEIYVNDVCRLCAQARTGHNE